MARRTPALSDRLAALDRALELVDGRVDPARVERAHAVRGKADERLARGEGLVVAALVGGTGSGKSSLFNALTGAELSPVGVRRPTTEVPRAALGAEAADAGGGRLLDWLEVPQRHVDPPGVRAHRRIGGHRGRRDAPAGWPEALVLLDVPDHDSVAASHRAVVDRLVERVDVLVWVVDPVKYAMRALHEGYLGRLATHADIVLVVLNRTDELSERDIAVVRDDLRALLDAEGLGRARLLATSARTGHGVADLADVLAEEVGERTATARRLAGDLRATAADLRVDVGDEPAGPLDLDGVVEALAGAAGVGGVAAAAAEESRAAAMAGSRPVVSRAGAAVASRGPALLRHLRGYLPGGGAAGRSRPSAHTAPIGVRHAVVEVVDRCAAPLPPRWRVRLHEAAGVDSGALARAVAAAVDRVPLRSPRRWWWSVVAAVLSLFELAVLVGVLWLGILAVLGWLQLPAPDPPPVVGEVPWPTALLLGGLLLRVVGGVVRRRLAGLGARRYRRVVALQLMDAVRDVAERRVVIPLREELAAREELRELLDDLAS